MMDYKEKYGVDLGREARRLAEIWEKEKSGEAVMTTKSFTITKSEYDALPLHKQQALYDEFPEEVTALIKGSK